jgi:hypothetical protein
MQGTPDEWNILPLVTYATTALATWGMTVGTTNITLFKSGAAGSGGTTAGTTVIAKVWVKAPHTISQ